VLGVSDCWVRVRLSGVARKMSGVARNSEFSAYIVRVCVLVMSTATQLPPPAGARARRRLASTMLTTLQPSSRAAIKCL
jgi:hypothetical protein